MTPDQQQNLHSFLNKRFGKANPPELERISGGQSNPTWFLTFGGKRMVLRAKPPGKLLKGAHAIEREFRIMKALAQTDVPVPTVICLEEELSALGVPFYLMERVEGRVLSDCALPGMSADERRKIYNSLAETLAKLHAIKPDDIGLGDFGRPGNYFERQIGRWSQQYQASQKRIPQLDALLEWLPANLPKDDGDISIAHGDFRLGNMILHPTEPRIVAVLDWELSTIGHPLADLGFCVMPWHSSPDEYGGIIGLETTELGIPAETDFVAHYFENARPTSPLLPFHIAFALFRFSVIFVGISERAKAGNAASNEAEQLEPLAKAFALRALEATV